ncbi:hypothetical protein B0H15DRAFT_804424 [Mycena belliarum]|uniref:Uncharacterized protein n=1 Tax=Mycena belliarum TaxID=1033014 RepID=A0AAD6TXD7_9AGAR|nr:hypothetical protein B0H15DRAFT_804424 [Mycena belliae]
MASAADTTASPEQDTSHEAPARRKVGDRAYRPPKKTATVGPPPKTRAKAKGVQDGEAGEGAGGEEETREASKEGDSEGGHEEGESARSNQMPRAPDRPGELSFADLDDDDQFGDDPATSPTPSHGLSPATEDREASPSPDFPSSPTQQRGRTVEKTPPARRTNSARIAAKPQAPAKEVSAAASRSRTPARKGTPRAARGRPPGRTVSTPPAARKRAPTTTTPIVTPKPPPKKRARNEGAPAVALDGAERAVDNAVPHARAGTRRRVSFSQPGPSPTPTTPGSPYNAHFPDLSPATNRRKLPPQRSPVEARMDDAWDSGPEDGLVTLTRAQLEKLVASGPAGRMHHLTGAKEAEHPAPPVRVTRCRSSRPTAVSRATSWSVRGDAQRGVAVESEASAPSSRPGQRATAASRATSWVSYSTALRMPNAPSPKTRRVITLESGKELDPYNIAIPAHVVTSLQGGLKTYFPLSNLTTANCTNDRERRPKRKQFFIAGLEFATEESEHPSGSDDSISKADFIIAAERMVEAAAEHFRPSNLAAKFSTQLQKHFSHIRRQPDFDKNFWRWQMYHTAVIKRFVYKGDFNVGEFQRGIFENIRSQDYDRQVDSLKHQVPRPRPFPPAPARPLPATLPSPAAATRVLSGLLSEGGPRRRFKGAEAQGQGSGRLQVHVLRRPGRARLARMHGKDREVVRSP